MTTRSTRSSSDTRAVPTPAVATASPRLPFQQQKPKRQLVAPSPDAATPGKLPRTTAADRTARPIVFGSPVQPKLGPKLFALPSVQPKLVAKAPWRPTDAEAGSSRSPQVQQTAPAGSRLAIKSGGMGPCTVAPPVIATAVPPAPLPPLTNLVNRSTKAMGGGRKKSVEPSSALSKPARRERRRELALPVEREWERLPFPLPFPLEVGRLDFVQATGLTNEEAQHIAHAPSPPKSMFARTPEAPAMPQTPFVPSDSHDMAMMHLFASACGDVEPASGSTPPKDREFVAAVHKAFHERCGGGVTSCSLPDSPVRKLENLLFDMDWESVAV